MITLTLVIELPDVEEEAGRITDALMGAFTQQTPCTSVENFTVVDLGFGNRLTTPLTFTVTETKESP